MTPKYPNVLTTAEAALSQEEHKQLVMFIKNNVSFFSMHAKGTHFTESKENRDFAFLNAVKCKRNLMNARGKHVDTHKIMSSSTIFNIVEPHKIFVEKIHPQNEVPIYVYMGTS